LHIPPRFWIKTLSLEAETAINILPTPDQDPIRYQVARTIEKLANKTIHNNSQTTFQNRRAQTERGIIKGVRNKLNQYDALVTKADKGQSIIIIKRAEYNDKVQEFLSNNNFQTTHKNPTNTFQRETKKTINSCPTIIPANTKWKYTNMNPKSPTIRGLIKLHKLNAPIRPIINWQQAPAYKLAKFLSERLRDELKLPFTFKIKNSLQLMNELQSIELYSENLRLTSFDVTNMYTNIPTSQLPTIINNICKHQNTPQTTKKNYLNHKNYFKTKLL
jgi:hypothetical protein